MFFWSIWTIHLRPLWAALYMTWKMWHEATWNVTWIYSGDYQTAQNGCTTTATSKVELFMTIVNSFQPLMIFHKVFHFRCCSGPRSHSNYKYFCFAKLHFNQLEAHVPLISKETSQSIWMTKTMSWYFVNTSISNSMVKQLSGYYANVSIS